MKKISYAILVFGWWVILLSSGGAAIFPYTAATYTTYFQTGLEREKNIQISVRKLNGFILHPGSEFSFNETVTWQIPRDELGYAPSIINGKLLLASGGGLCQVASTLYAAALSAGLTITERKNHSSPVGYIAPGLDATVSSTEGIDLKFRNEGTYPFLITAEEKEGCLTIAILSCVAPDRKITLSVTHPSIDGPCINVVTIRKISFENGYVITEVISRDRYIR